jgi:hypothetical protein
MAVRIGIIAEEDNDVDVLYELTCKLTPESNFRFSKFVGHGCGKLRRKCGAWARNLIQRGCSHIVVMHDLDSNDKNVLYTELEGDIRHIGREYYLILIPVHEIEAWLLFDPVALKETFGMRKAPKTPTTPEKVSDPKKCLRDIVRKSCEKQYINTIHNKRIARAVRINKLLPCTSFSPYPDFLNLKVKV